MFTVQYQEPYTHLAGLAGQSAVRPGTVEVLDLEQMKEMAKGQERGVLKILSSAEAFSC